MTTVFHTWPNDRFIEIQSNLRRKKLHRTNQGSNFLGGSFSNRDNVRAPIQFRRESQPQQESKFRHNFQDSLDPFCNCAWHIETTIHFFLHCSNYSNQRKTVCFYQVTYVFQSESTLYSCLNVKELLA